MKRLALIAMLAMFAGPALAIDFTQTIKTFDGKDFTDAEGKPVPQVLGTVIENSLLATNPSDTPEEKNKRFWLALKLHEKAKDYTPSPDELVLMKKALQVQPIAIMGQATRMIDPSYGK